MKREYRTLQSSILASAAALAVLTASAFAIVPGDDAKKPDYPPFADVVKGLTKVVSTTGGESSLYDLYFDDEKGKLLAVLPSSYEKQLVMVACTVSGGHPESGVMGPTHYLKWRKIGKRLVLAAPDFSVRTEGDAQAKDSLKELYTDRVLLDVPIMSMSGSKPVIDLGAIMTKKVKAFFGPSPFGQYGPGMTGLNPALAKFTSVKAFPSNVIVEVEAPAMNGKIQRVTYAIGELGGSKGYKPRKADPRVGYFYNWHQDFARPTNSEITDRYITRWNLEKADASLKLSPPKQPIVWYIEHTTPIRYRRYIREGIEMWNQAFREVGFVDAVVVYQQDSASGAHMEKDPADARFNFFRWNVNNAGYAIGPSRTNPETGEILDADVVWNQGLTRSLTSSFGDLAVSLTEGRFGAETLAWFEEHPDWDPRVRMGSQAFQAQSVRRIQAARDAIELELEDQEHPWTMGANDMTNSACRIGNQFAMDLSLAGAAVSAGLLSVDDAEQTLDGVPEEFLGPMMRYIAAHEVGHCMGLQHNMAASTIHTLEEINSEGFTGPLTGSVMDYCAVNINHECGEVQGPFATPELGPYDKWAIACGYGAEDKVDENLARVNEPGHVYVSQIGMSVGSDPRNMTWDLGANNIDFAVSRLGLVNELRGKILDELVEDGDSWSEARRRFGMLMNTHVSSLFLVSPWIGGSYENYAFKGDPGDKAPVEDVPAAEQRRAINLIIKHSFEDEAFGITPELVRHIGKQYWWDPAGMNELMADPSMELHNVVGQIQAIGLTLVMNPSTLRRIYDNEFRTQGQDDVLTLAETLSTVTNNVWRECTGNGKGTVKNPLVSSFRRNLQHEHVKRLIDLALIRRSTSPSLRTISSLAALHLRQIDSRATRSLASEIDPYTSAHLTDVRARIEKALNAMVVVGR